MSYAIDLNERQTARTLEQAVRHNAIVLLEPRIWSVGEVLRCRLEPSESPVPGRRLYAAPLIVVTCPEDEPAVTAVGGQTGRAAEIQAVERLSPLIGTYCDVTLQLGEHRYLFSTDVTHVEPAGPGQTDVRLYLRRPDVIQVAQRRRFRRIQLPQASQVEIRWHGEDGGAAGGVGWLYNIGEDGIACRTDTVLADRLYIGQEVVIDFSIRPGEAERFVLDAVICNKTPAGNQDRTVIGLQFLAGEGHEASAAVREWLRRRLRAISYSPPGVRKGVDA